MSVPLDTTSQTIHGAINELNSKNTGEIICLNTNDTPSQFMIAKTTKVGDYIDLSPAKDYIDNGYRILTIQDKSNNSFHVEFGPRKRTQSDSAFTLLVTPAWDPEFGVQGGIIFFNPIDTNYFASINFIQQCSGSNRVNSLADCGLTGGGWAYLSIILANMRQVI